MVTIRCSVGPQQARTGLSPNIARPGDVNIYAADDRYPRNVPQLRENLFR